MTLNEKKMDNIIYLLITIAGIISSFCTFHLLNGYPFNTGKNLIGAFIPPFLVVIYISYSNYRNTEKKVYIKAIISYCIQILPFAPLFMQRFIPTYQDDFARYYIYAKNMMDNHTLWGGDSLVFKNTSSCYVTQPGYRYFVLVELLLFKNLIRIVSFLNIAIFITAVYNFQKVINHVIIDNIMRLSLIILTILITPFGIKNLLMGLPEWITFVLLLQFAFYLLIKKQIYVSTFLLALIPFFRQNLLISVLLIFILIIYNHPQKIKLIACFICTLLIPLYHNLYYAKQWRFFVDIFSLPFIQKNHNDGILSGLDFNFLGNNIVHYLGIDIIDGKWEISFIAILFLPFSLLILFKMIQSFHNNLNRTIFLAITFSAVLPVIFLGMCYYPRFEFINVSIMYVTYCLILNYSQKLQLRK